MTKKKTKALVDSKIIKNFIDSTDRDILRTLYRKKRPLTGNRISKLVKISPSATSYRLKRLNTQGIVKPVKFGGERVFKRRSATGHSFKRVVAPRSISWDLDLIKKKKKH